MTRRPGPARATTATAAPTAGWPMAVMKGRCAYSWRPVELRSGAESWPVNRLHPQHRRSLLGAASSSIARAAGPRGDARLGGAGGARCARPRTPQRAPRPWPVHCRQPVARVARDEANRRPHEQHARSVRSVSRASSQAGEPQGGSALGGPECKSTRWCQQLQRAFSKIAHLFDCSSSFSLRSAASAAAASADRPAGLILVGNPFAVT